MKNLTHIIRTGALMLLTSLNIASCIDGNDWETTSTDRLFGTKNSSFSVTPAAITAEVKWDATPNTEYYLIEASQENMTDNEAMSETTGSIVFGQDRSIKKPPYTLTGLLGETTYYLRIKSVGQGKESRWVYLADETFKTAKEQILNNISESDVTYESVRITWEAGSAVTHFAIKAGDEQPTERPISEEEMESGIATVNNLTPATLYTIYIYNGTIKRGEIQATTGVAEMAYSEVTEIKQTTARYSWNTSLTSADINGYAILKGAIYPTDITSNLTIDQIGSSSIELTNLEPSTIYTVAVMKNKVVRTLQRFKTARAIPASYQQVIVTTLDEWNTALKENNGAVAIIIPEGTDLDLGSAGSNNIIPANITSLLVWGGATEGISHIKPILNTKGFIFNGTFDTIEFFNLNLQSEISDANYYLIDQQTSIGNINYLAMESCGIQNCRGVLRSRTGNIGVCKSYVINDCVLTAVGDYGIFNIDSAPFVQTMSLTNSTVNTIASSLLKSKVAFVLTIDQCTLYGLTAQILNESVSSTVNISNTLLGGFSNLKVCGNSSRITLTDKVNVYTVSDASYQGTNSWGSMLTVSSTQLFEASETGDFTVKLEEYKTSGDPRWNK